MAEPSRFIRLHGRESDFGNSTGDIPDSSIRKFIGHLILENSVQNRTAIILLASFNVAAAIIMIVSIVYDAWKSSKRRRLIPLNEPTRLDFLRRINCAEIVPLALSIGIAVQGAIFIGVQATGMNSIFVSDCNAFSQLIWTATWIVAYVLLVFSMEVAWRGFQRRKFAPRGQWNTWICWIIVVVMLALTWIPSNINPFKEEHCLANLVWWAAPWSHVGVVIASALIGLYTLTAFTIGYQLFRTVKLSREDRISASRTVYYLAVGTVLMAFILPFFISVTRRKDGDITSKIAGIVLNLFGLVMGFLHLLLRSNADVTVIKPSDSPTVNRRPWKFFGSNGLDVGIQIQSPVPIERSLSKHALARSPSEKCRGLLSPETPEATIDIRSPRTPKTAPESVSRPPTATTPALVRKKSHNYSVFPANGPRANKLAQKAMESGDDSFVLLPPQPLFIRRHQRDSSNISSATVQIGLRLSHGILPPGTEVLGPLALHVPIQSPDSPQSFSRTKTSPLSQSTPRDSSTASMDLPIQFKPATPSPQSSPRQEPPASTLPPQLQALAWPKRTVSLRNRRNGAQIVQKLDGDYRMKSLPPIPGRPVSEVMTLSSRGSGPQSLPRRSMSNPSPGNRRPPGRRDHA